MTATELEMEQLRAAVEKATLAYSAKKVVFRAMQDATEDAALAMEDAWCNLVMARWEQARALGIDPHQVCFLED